MNKTKIYLLRFIHGLFAFYFILCLLYLYYAAIFPPKDNLLLILALLSLLFEGIVVFLLNKGDCPLIHIQRRIGDDTPFFELFLPAETAKRAIPFFATLTWVVLGLLIIRFIFLRFG